MKPFFPPNRQGIAIDLVVILCNLILFPIVAARIDVLFNAFFSNERSGVQILPLLMMAILAGRLVGLYLKRFPLQARLSQASDGSFPLFFFIFSFPLIVLTAAFVMISLMSTAGEVGLVETGADGMAKPSQAVELLGTFSILFLALLEGYLIYRLSRPLTAEEQTKPGQRSLDLSVSGRACRGLRPVCLYDRLAGVLSPDRRTADHAGRRGTDAAGYEAGQRVLFGDLLSAVLPCPARSFSDRRPQVSRNVADDRVGVPEFAQESVVITARLRTPLWRIRRKDRDSKHGSLPAKGFGSLFRR